MKVKVTEYSIHHDAIRWRISALQKSHLRIFRSLSPFSRYSHFRIPDVEDIVNVMIHSFAVVQIDGKYLTFNVMAILMFALSFTVFEI